MLEITELRAWRIGAVSQTTGVNIETIRYYERVGVVPRPPRGAGGQRVYSQSDVRRLSFVRRARELGFSLDEIRRLLSLADEVPLSCEQVFQITSGHLASVRAKIADLQRLASLLEQMAGECSRGDVPDCPIIEALFDGD